MQVQLQVSTFTDEERAMIQTKKEYLPCGITKYDLVELYRSPKNRVREVGQNLGSHETNHPAQCHVPFFVAP